MRRCPMCPTEYLIEIKMAEDRSDPDPRRRFKQALVVTRWSDLGDGSGPWPEMSKEWASLCDGDVAREFPLPAEPKAAETEVATAPAMMATESEATNGIPGVDPSTATAEGTTNQDNSNTPSPTTPIPTPPLPTLTQMRTPSPPPNPSQSQFDASFDPNPFSTATPVEEYTYDSFAVLGKRAISGIFESWNTTTGDTLPGQRMVSMNPEGEHRGEKGHGWY